MPLYEYQCEKCGRFELIVKFSDPPLGACPTCGGTVQKLFSSPAIQFKGSGFYITDYAKKASPESSGGKGSSDKSSSDKSADKSSSDKSSSDKSSGDKSAGEKSDKSANDASTSKKTVAAATGSKD